MRWLILALLTLTTTSEGCFYLKAGSGVSFSESAHVHAPSPTWNQALQGYHSKLGNRAIGDVGLGYRHCDLVDLEVSLSTRCNFKYRKFQTPLDGGDSYRREFDLDVTPLLFSATLLGKNLCSWDFACGTIYPILGAGVGVSRLLITNFRTTGLPPTGNSSPFESFSAENEYTRRTRFTYTAQVGLEYSSDCFAITTGYRFLDAGKFRGPRYLRVAPGGAVDVGSEAWKMRFRSNEWFIELAIFL